MENSDWSTIYPCLLSGGLVLATLKSSVYMQGASLFWCTTCTAFYIFTQSSLLTVSWYSMAFLPNVVIYPKHFTYISKPSFYASATKMKSCLVGVWAMLVDPWESTDQISSVRHIQVMFVQIHRELYWLFCSHVPKQRNLFECMMRVYCEKHTNRSEIST